MRFAALLAFLMIVGASLAATVVAAESTSDGCMVLIDFGNGETLWTSVIVEEGMNAFNITVNAATQLGLGIDSEASPVGVRVKGIGGITGDGPNEWWYLWIWNSIGKTWQIATETPSFIESKNLTAIAWVYAMPRPGWMPHGPLATPENKYPWTTFRHDISNTGMSQAVSPLNLNKVWDKNLTNGPISTTVVTAGGLLYVMTTGVYNWTGMKYDSRPSLVCLDSEGRVLWNASMDGAGYQIASPLITENFVVIPSTDGKLYAFDSKTGSPYWESATEFSWTGITSSPILYRNQVIVGGGDGKLYSFGENGSIIWSTKISSSIYFSSPAASNGTIYIGSEDGKLHAVEDDGSGEIWNVSVGGKVRSAPLLLADQIVVTYSVYEGFVAVDGGAVGFSYGGEELWRVDVNATSTSPASTSGGVVVSSVDGLTMISEDGSIEWKASLGAPIKGSPSVSSEAIYVVTYEELSKVYAINFSGAIIWSSPLEPRQYSMCSPTLTDGMLYITSDNGHVYAFSAAVPESGGNIWFLIAMFVFVFAILLIGAIGNWIAGRRLD